MLPAPIHYSESGEEIRRYLAYITTDKVQKKQELYITHLYLYIGWSITFAP